MSLCEIAKKNYDNERKILEDALIKASSNHTELIKVIKDVYFKRINPDKFAYMKKEDIFYVLNNIVTNIEEKYNKSSDVVEYDQIDNTILSNNDTHLTSITIFPLIPQHYYKLNFLST